MPVHVYGRPAAVEEIQRIADTYGLKVIYDAAHAFGVDFGDRSLAGYGDLAILSFHATKVFNTFEGGAIVCHDPQTKQRIDYLKNFGFADEVTVVAPGINGKMNEFQSAIGLLQLRHIDECIRQRGEVAARYDNAFAGLEGLSVMADTKGWQRNHGYYPIFVDDRFPLPRDQLHFRLREAGVVGRRYFYPLISDFPMYRGRPSAAPAGLPIARAVSREVICLPIYPELTRDDQQRVIEIIRGAT